MASAHEEEVLGKAYDSRLMKRLLRYLAPYKWQVAIALGSIFLKVGADVLIRRQVPVPQRQGIEPASVKE